MRYVMIFSFIFASFLAQAETLPVGLLRCPASECHASLVGPRLILTNAHCLPADATACIFTSAQGASAQLTKNIVTGGGTDEEAKFKGHDWALAEINTPLGNSLGFFRLHEKELSENQVVEFVAAPQPETGHHPQFQAETCNVLPPPQWALERCTTNSEKKDQTTCNFFAHTCDAGSATSGAPLFLRGERDLRLVGIHSGRTKLDDGSEVRWAQTVSPTADLNANISFHWWTMLNYELLDLLQAGGASAQALSYDRNDEKATRIAGLLGNTDSRSFAPSVDALRTFSTWQHQWAVYRTLRDLLDMQRQRRPLAITTNYFQWTQKTPTLIPPPPKPGIGPTPLPPEGPAPAPHDAPPPPPDPMDDDIPKPRYEEYPSAPLPSTAPSPKPLTPPPPAPLPDLKETP